MVTFHQVGQGLFASETFENHTIVYDCGGENADIVRNATDSDFVGSLDIDILFISHYDRDHINGIFHLLEWHKVRHVILPLVSDFSRYLSFNSYDGLKHEELPRFYSDPEKYINEISPVTHCHFLRDANISISTTNRISIDNLSHEIDSNVHIIVVNDWLLIPYNRKVVTKQEERRLMSKLKLNPDYGFDQILEKWPKISSTLKKELISAGTVNKYNINDYCMTLYSHNAESKTLYLGDYNAKSYCNELKTVYALFWEDISCLQVPHHGSQLSFNKGLIIDRDIDYVISNNRYPKSSKKVDPQPVMDILNKHGKKTHITGNGIVKLKVTDRML